MGFIGDIFEGIGDLFEGVFDFIGDAFEWLTDNPMILITGAMALMGLPGPIDMLFGAEGVFGGTVVGEAVMGVSNFLGGIGTAVWETISGGFDFLTSGITDSLAGDLVTDAMFDEAVLGEALLEGGTEAVAEAAADGFLSAGFDMGTMSGLGESLLSPTDMLGVGADEGMNILGDQLSESFVMGEDLLGSTGQGFADFSVDNALTPTGPGAAVTAPGAAPGFNAVTPNVQAGGSGWFDKMTSGLGDRGQAALIHGGISAVTGMISGIYQEEMMEETRAWQEHMMDKQMANANEKWDKGAAYGVARDGTGTPLNAGDKLKEVNRRYFGAGGPAPFPQQPGVQPVQPVQAVAGQKPVAVTQNQQMVQPNTQGYMSRLDEEEYHPNRAQQVRSTGVVGL